MLYVYDKTKKVFTPCEETDFASHEIMERKDIEKWLVDSPEILGEELLVITTEYAKFDKTKERLDLLALDKQGKLVIVELKREEGGRNVDLQAIKYASYCSTLTLDRLISLQQEFLSKKGLKLAEDEVRDQLLNFIDNDEFEELDDRPRVMLVARGFRPEVTASVLWLRKFGIDISCIELIPHRIDDNRIGIVSSTIIPLPEAKEYLIEAERKDDVERTLSRRQKEYVQFYQELSQAIKEKIPNIPTSEPQPKAYYPIPTGISGIHFEWGFHGRPRSSFGVELHFERGNKDQNRIFLKEIEKSRDEIERETGEKVTFQEDWGKAWSRLYMERNEGAMTDELKKWALEKMSVLYKLLQPKLEHLR